MKNFIFLLIIFFFVPSAFAVDNCDAPENYVVGTDPTYTGYSCVNLGNTANLPSMTKSCEQDRPGRLINRGRCGTTGNYYNFTCFKKKQPCSSSSASAASSSAPSCPSGQVLDSLGKCNTKCDASQGVYNPVANACQEAANCTYPSIRSPITNTCSPNEDNCALNANVNVISGYVCQQCAGCPPPYCPAGFTLTETNQCVPNATSSAPSSTASGSSQPATSSPSSSGSNSSVPRPQPPTNSNDNTDQGQSTGNSQSIPVGISNNDCLNSFTTTACTVVQNCQLTFGTENCLGVTGDMNCPNSYVVNGQKICVLNTSGSNSSGGSNTSSGGNNGNSSESGECDPTSKNYLRCLTVRELQVPEDRGSFDETKAAQALHEAKEDLQTKIDAIKTEMNQVLSVGIDGSGTITDNCLTIVGQEVCFGFAKFTGLLDIIPWAIMLLAYLAALFVILRK